jgi:hypothetical protein
MDDEVPPKAGPRSFQSLAMTWDHRDMSLTYTKRNNIVKLQSGRRKSLGKRG